MRYWINGRALFWSAGWPQQDLVLPPAAGKTCSIRARLPTIFHRMLGRVGSIFLIWAYEVLGTVRYTFVFAMAKYKIDCF